MNPIPVTEKKPYLETSIHREEDGTLARCYINLESEGSNIRDVAEVLAQYLCLRDVVQKSMEAVKKIGERRFGEAAFNKACANAWEELGKNADVLRAIELIPWAEPDQLEG